MTNSFRGEIFSLMDCTYIDAEWGTNKILKFFESRINSRIKELKKKKTLHYQFKINELRNFKKEMMK